MPFRDDGQDWAETDGAAGLEALATALTDDDEPRPRRPLSRWWLLVLATAGIAGSLALFATLTLGAIHEQRTLAALQARNHVDALRQSFANAQVMLHAARSAVVGARPVTRTGFRAMASDMRRLFPGLLVMGWTPRVRVRDIPALEAMAAEDGIPGFRVRNADGTRPQDALGPDDEVFPILYDSGGTVPPPGGRPYGVNVLSLPGRREMLWRACSSGDVLAATWNTLTTQPGNPGSFILYLAAYDANLATTFPYDACPKLTGLLSAIIRVDTLMAITFRTLGAMEEDIYVVDGAAPEGRKILGVYPGRHPEGAFLPLTEAELGTVDNDARHWLEIGGLELTVAFVRPHVGDWSRAVPQIAWAALVVGLLTTVIVAGFLARLGLGNLRLIAEAERRRRVERALRASEFRFRLALRDSKVTVFSQDRELRYTWIFNPTLGLAARDIIGRRHSELFPGEATRELEDIKRSVMETGFSVRRDVVFMVKGQPQVHDMRIEPLHDRTGAIAGIIAVAVNITEARQMREDLSRAVADAQRATAAKSRFLAAASHDLRQPFQAMQLYHELLTLRLNTREQGDICRHLGDSIRTGRELLTALLDVSTLDAGIIRPRVTAFSLGPSLEGLLAEFKEQTAAVGIRLRLVPTTVAVRSDRVLLERILRNLVTNAVRYTRQGRILIGCRRRGDAVDIQVFDTGVGIPADQMDLVFEDFYQVGNPERKLSQGLGLGLGIVARTSRLLGHPVAVRSRPGRGSMFSVTVALGGRDEAPLSREPAAEGGIPPQRILIIEDDDMQRHALQLLLEDSGHSVNGAGNPDQARELVATLPQQPTVIISDLRLPGPSSGVDLIRELQGRLGPVHALLVTGDTDQSQLQYAASAGITMLHKPFNHAALLDVLRELFISTRDARLAPAHPHKPPQEAASP